MAVYPQAPTCVSKWFVQYSNTKMIDPSIPVRIPCADMDNKGDPLLSSHVSYVLPQLATVC